MLWSGLAFVLIAVFCGPTANVRYLLINVGQLYTKKLGPKPGVVKNASIEGYYCIWFVQEPLKKIDLSKKVSWIIAWEKISIELSRKKKLVELLYCFPIMGFLPEFHYSRNEITAS